MIHRDEGWGRHGRAHALEPGQWVRHPGHAEWGLGQVQSAIGERVTVNFENAGKVLVNADHVALQVEAQPH